MAVRHHRVKARIATYVAVTFGMFSRFSEQIFGENTFLALVTWHAGSTVCKIALCYLATLWASKEFKPYLKALYPIFVAQLASDLLNRGNTTILDYIGIGFGITYIIYVLIKRR